MTPAKLILGLVIILLLGVVFVQQQALSRPTPNGQDIGNGVTTTCNGMDRLYFGPSGSIAVVHNDTSCDSEG